MLLVGTFFSGCEVFSCVLEALGDLWQTRLGESLPMALQFVVEKDQWKRDFIQTVSDPAQVFENVVALAENGWRGVNEKSGEAEDIKDCHVLAAGFECDSVSRLNAASSQFRDCVRCAQGRTGTTAAATLQLVQARRPPFVFLENVKTLGKKNRDESVKVLNAARHLVWTPVLEASCFGAVCKSERQFMIAVALPADIAADQTKEEWHMPPWGLAVATTLNTMKIGPGCLMDCLLLDSDRRLVEWLSRERGAAQKLNRRPVDRLKHDWPVVHQTMYLEEGWSWPPDIRQQGGVDFANAVAHLPESDQEKTFYYEFIKPGPGTGLCTFDFNPSMNWGSCSPQLLPTITCRAWPPQVLP